MSKFPSKIMWGRCEYCHKDFEYRMYHYGGRPRKYCCRECANKSNVELIRARKKQLAQERREEELKKSHVLEDTMKLLHEQGMTDADYAKYQKEKTLALVGRVLV